MKLITYSHNDSISVGILADKGLIDIPSIWLGPNPPRSIKEILTRGQSCLAKLIKLADKIHNVHELGHEPPADWTRSRLIAYVGWADEVVAGLRGANAPLERAYDDVADQVRSRLNSKPDVSSSMGG